MPGWHGTGACSSHGATAQVFYQGQGELSDFPYDSSQEVLDSTFHDMGDFETHRRWCRAWCGPAAAWSMAAGPVH